MLGMIKEKADIQKPFLQTLKGEITDKIPFWFMRQAGRYLPEYRKLRSECNGFLDMAYTPEKASEITLQPIRRFGMDAAIIFSDILVVPNAMGQALDFVAGEGPKLDPIRRVDDFKKLDAKNPNDIFKNVYTAITQTREMLNEEGFQKTALIGFSGAPWTVACYMVEGGGSKDFEYVRKWAQRDPEGFGELIDRVSRVTADYLIGQIEAGAEAVQIFDSWSGVLSAREFQKWVIAPTKKIVKFVKDKYPDVPVIGFPRNAGPLYGDFITQTGVDVVSTDYQLSPQWIADNLQSRLPVQGNLDPVALLSGGDALISSAETILENLGPNPFVFNLGHGVIKETPIDHVEQLCEIIRNFQR